MRLHAIPLLCSALLCAATPCLAQHYSTDRGVWTLGGTARISNSRDIGNDASTFIIDLNPRLGYFVLPGLALTANLEYAHFSSDGGSSSLYGVGPGLTYYLRHRRTVLNPFLSGRTLYVNQRFNPDGGTSTTETSFTWLVSGGAAVFLARNVALTGELFYSHDHFSTDISGPTQSNSSEEYGTQFGVSVYIF